MITKIRSIVVVLLIVKIAHINGDLTKHFNGKTGRLLTPEQGCGFVRVKNTRIVGGSEAKKGAWPWIPLLGFEKGNKTFFDCGKRLFYHLI